MLGHTHFLLNLSCIIIMSFVRSEIFWVMTLYSDVVGYLHLQGEVVGSMALKKLISYNITN